MSKRLNWRRAKLHDRRTLDYRWDEFGEFHVKQPRNEDNA